MAISLLEQVQEPGQSLGDLFRTRECQRMELFLLQQFCSLFQTAWTFCVFRIRHPQDYNANPDRETWQQNAASHGAEFEARLLTAVLLFWPAFPF